jgi:hypothetical protein
VNPNPQRANRPSNRLDTIIGVNRKAAAPARGRGLCATAARMACQTSPKEGVGTPRYPLVGAVIKSLRGLWGHTGLHGRSGELGFWQLGLTTASGGQLWEYEARQSRDSLLSHPPGYTPGPSLRWEVSGLALTTHPARGYGCLCSTDLNGWVAGA